MEKGAKIGIAALIIVFVTVPTIAYAFGEYLLPSAAFNPDPPLTLRVEISGSEFLAGEVMDLAFTLTNIAGRPIEITYPCGRLFDFLVRDATGQAIYNWTQENPCYLAVVYKIKIDAYRSIQLVLNWTPSILGTYMVTGCSTFWIDSGTYVEWFNLTAQPIPFEVIG